MNVNRTCWVATIVLTLSCGEGIAQQINNPNHIPNGMKNKVTKIRVQSLIEGENLRDETEELIPSGTDLIDPELFPNIDLFGDGGCSINIGNSVTGALGNPNDRTIVVAGDIINTCR